MIEKIKISTTIKFLHRLLTTQITQKKIFFRRKMLCWLKLIKKIFFKPFVVLKFWSIQINFFKLMIFNLLPLGNTILCLNRIIVEQAISH